MFPSPLTKSCFFVISQRDPINPEVSINLWKAEVTWLKNQKKKLFEVCRINIVINIQILTGTVMKYHVSVDYQERSKVQWGQMWKFTCKTLLGLITFQPYASLYQERSKVQWGQMWKFTCKTLLGLITVQPYASLSGNLSLLSTCRCASLYWFVEWMGACGRDTLRRSPCFNTLWKTLKACQAMQLRFLKWKHC